MRRSGTLLINKIDWLVVGLYAILVLLGWGNIYSAVYNEEHQSIFDLSQRYGQQLIWIFTAVILAIATLYIEERFYNSFGYLIFGTICLTLILVLLFGTEVKGAKSWFTIGGFRLQPSEFAKFATCLALSKYLSTLNVDIRTTNAKLNVSLIIGIPILLILLQGDAGSALVYFSLILVLFREGLSANILLIGVYFATIFILSLLLRSVKIDIGYDYHISGPQLLMFVLGILSLIMFYVLRKIKGMWLGLLGAFIITVFFITSVDYIFESILEPHQSKRINVLLGIESDPKGAGYNVHQSLIAIGSGGFWGKGYLDGTQTKYDFVPEQSTDFIFCTIGEEWGFIGSLIVILLYLGLFIKLVFMAERQRSKFSRIYGYSVACILFFHFAVNIGMTIGLAPVIGIPLPFISYGGSSLWAFTILLFIFVKLDADRMMELGSK